MSDDAWGDDPTACPDCGRESCEEHVGPPGATDSSEFVNCFERISDGRYRFSVPELSTEFELDQVRGDGHQLHASATVRCGLAGVKTYQGVLLAAALNLANLRDRDLWTRQLSAATNSDAPAWAAALHELYTRTKAAEDVGEGIVKLCDVPLPDADQFFRVGGLSIPKHHPTLFFGDGDSLKSYTGLFLLNELCKQGVRVAIADWELTAADHRARVERLADGDTEVIYIPCARPLLQEADRIGRAVRDFGIQYLLLDSAAPACNGRPEDAENASGYFRCLRSLGIGSLTIAHANRSESSDQKPFGSVFWFNLARAIWYVKRAETAVENVAEIGLYPRKFNLGSAQRATALRFEFAQTRTSIVEVPIADIDSLAARLPLKDRIRHLVRSRARTIEEIAAEIPDSDVESIKRTVRRYSGPSAKVCWFTRLPDERIGLFERKAS